jgi:chromate transporter
LTVGGGMAAFPEMETLVVKVYHWLTFPQLIHIYSVGQMSPGPNMMMVAGIGVMIAGLAGAVVAAVAFFGPTGVLTYAVGRIWSRFEGNPWRTTVQLALGPISIGLAVAGILSFGRGAVTGWVTAVLALVTFFIILRTNVNPTLVMLGAAVVGAVALQK